MKLRHYLLASVSPLAIAVSQAWEGAVKRRAAQQAAFEAQQLAAMKPEGGIQ